MTDCPGLNVVMGHGWNEQQHCPGCAGDSLLREQLAQAVTVLQLLYDQHKREMRSPQMTEVLRCLNQARKALADLPDEKEKP